MPRALSHVVGVDDGPFPSEHRGDVDLIGAVFTGLRLEGVLRGRVRRDGANATRAIVALIEGSRFREHLQAVLLQGIAFAGFNVVDIRGLNQRLGLPVIAVMRRRPDLEAVRRALVGSVPGGVRKWRLVEQAGDPEPVAGVYVQRTGMGLAEADALVRQLAVHGRIPEPLRTAHLIAGGIGPLPSRQRV